MSALGDEFLPYAAPPSPIKQTSSQWFLILVTPAHKAGSQASARSFTVGAWVHGILVRNLLQWQPPPWLFSVMCFHVQSIT